MIFHVLRYAICQLISQIRNHPYKLTPSSDERNHVQITRAEKRNAADDPHTCTMECIGLDL